MNEEKIKAEAKQIMNFAKSLEKVQFKESPKREKLSGFRKETPAKKPNEDFKKRIFKNAPETEDDYLIAEKKTW